MAESCGLIYGGNRLVIRLLEHLIVAKIGLDNEYSDGKNS